MTTIKPNVTDEMTERALWAWIENATEGVTRENVNPRVLDLNRHRAVAALEAAAPLIAAQALREAADAFGEDQLIREGDVKEWLRARAEALCGGAS
jgi:hypothetical protein